MLMKMKKNQLMKMEISSKVRHYVNKMGNMNIESVQKNTYNIVKKQEMNMYEVKIYSVSE